jgi:hypothetical protein
VKRKNLLGQPYHVVSVIVAALQRCNLGAPSLLWKIIEGNQKACFDWLELIPLRNPVSICQACGKARATASYEHETKGWTLVAEYHPTGRIYYVCDNCEKSEESLIKNGKVVPFYPQPKESK